MVFTTPFNCYIMFVCFFFQKRDSVRLVGSHASWCSASSRCCSSKWNLCPSNTSWSPQRKVEQTSHYKSFISNTRTQDTGTVNINQCYSNHVHYQNLLSLKMCMRRSIREWPVLFRWRKLSMVYSAVLLWLLQSNFKKFEWVFEIFCFGGYIVS